MTRLLVAAGDLLVARSESEGWDQQTQLMGAAPYCLAGTEEGNRIYCGTTRRGLWRSDDGGLSWRHRSEGIPSALVTAVAVAPDGTVYAGTEPTALYRSDDGGDSWRELPGLPALPSAPTWRLPDRPYTSHIRQILAHRTRPGWVAACVEAGALVRSLDGGETWLDREPDGPVDTHTLRTHPALPDRLCSAAGDGFGRSRGFPMPGAGSGYNESPDAGGTWLQLDQGLDGNRVYAWGLAIEPADPEIMVISVSASPDTAHTLHEAESTICRRGHDGGWVEVSDGLPDPRGSVAAVLTTNPAESTGFYAAGSKGVFRSLDGGLSWSPLPLVWPEAYRGQPINDALVLPD